MASSPFSITVILLVSFMIPTSSQSDLCRTSCGEIPIHFPFSIDDGCGSPYYRRLLFCSTTNTLHLRTPSGVYPVLNISYSTDTPHLIVSDPSMFSSCNSTYSSAVTTPFALDTSTHLTLSTRNTFLFLNCSPKAVLMEPKLDFCRTFPEQCGDAGDSSSVVCDSEGYFCSEIPRCGGGTNGPIFVSCCEYFPEASESIRVMLRHCDSYTSMYWKKVSGNEIGLEGVDEIPEYGINIDYEIPMTGRCRQCEEKKNGGGGVCGFDTNTTDFLCLCGEGNITTHCGNGGGIVRPKSNTRVIVGTSAAVSVAGICSAGAVVWFVKKLRSNKVVACGVQSNENRLF